MKKILLLSITASFSLFASSFLIPYPDERNSILNINITCQRNLQLPSTVFSRLFGNHEGNFVSYMQVLCSKGTLPMIKQHSEAYMRQIYFPEVQSSHDGECIFHGPMDVIVNGHQMKKYFIFISLLWSDGYPGWEEKACFLYGGSTEGTPHPEGTSKATPHPEGTSKVTPRPEGTSETTPHPEGTSETTPHPEGTSKATPRPEGTSEATPRPEGTSEATSRPEGTSETTPHPEGTSETTPHPEGTSEATPRPEGTSEETPRPEGTSEETPRPEGTSEATPRPEGTSKATPRPESTSEETPHPEGTSEATSRPEGTSETTPHPEGTSETTPHPEGTSKATPRPEGTSEATPRPEGTSEETPHPEGTSEETPHPEGTSEETPRPEETSETSPRPEGTGEETPRPEGTSEETPRPEGTGEETPRPEGTGEETPRPEGTGEETPRPEGTGEETPRPEGTSEETPRPEGTSEETPRPEGTSEETPRPEGTGKETPPPEGTSEETPPPGAIIAPDPYVSVTAKCDNFENKNGNVEIYYSTLHLVTDILMSAIGHCQNESIVNFQTNDFVNYYLKVYYKQSDTVPDKEGVCIFDRSSGMDYRLRVEVSWGERYDHIHTFHKSFTVTCQFTNATERIDRTSVQSSIKEGFMNYRDVEGTSHFDTKSIISLRVANILGKPLGSPTIALGRTIRLRADSDGGSGELGISPVSCDAIGVHTNQRYGILRAGCGDGVIIPKHKGFMTTDCTVLSPYFTTFALSTDTRLRFECNFTMCESKCDGSSCHEE